jgi:hypothetical protein
MVQDTPYVAPGCPPCVPRRSTATLAFSDAAHARGGGGDLKIKGEGRGRIPLPTLHLQNTPHGHACVCAEGYRERCTRHTVLRGSAYTQMTGERPVPGRGIARSREEVRRMKGRDRE